MIGRAHAALARYDALLQVLVNPDLLLAPLRTREAVLSSRIEGTRATLEEVLEEAADPGVAAPPRRSEIREILNYREAVRVALEELERRPLSLNLIRRIHETLLAEAPGASRAPGEFRRVQNYVGVAG
ncbi:MAG TPA: Fic/DOC family N-terminal domain-containing protein, partial [Longimicrobiales bacterium]|nr:Fic/DOC family N-terminal domain-containing protein [Longimicrobiales bacterium]